MVSIITPVYNRERYIEECIRSVQAQSYQDFEIVIVDDGSTDKTTEICSKLAAEDTRIKLLTGEHKGVSAARNIALDAAQGEYVFFLDSDDVIYPMLLETLVLAMQNSGAALGGSAVLQVSEQNWFEVQKKLKEPPVTGETYFEPHENATKVILGGYSPFSCIGGVMMRRNFIGHTKFQTSLYIGEDYYFIYENLIKGADCIFLKPKWYYVRNHAHNISWDYSFDGFWTRFLRRKLVWESEESFGRTEYAAKQKRDAFGCFVRCIKKNKPYSQDNKKMRQVMKAHKSNIFPILNKKEQLLYWIYTHAPFATALLFRLKG